MKCLQSALFAIALLLIASPGSAQNLVPDSSFEAVSSHFCGIVLNPNQFNTLFDDWTCPTNGAGDQYSLQVDTTCINHCTNPSPMGPIPPKGMQAPHTGDVFAGIFLYTIPGLAQREYIQTRLSTPLTIGDSYEISAWVSLADFSEFATSSFDFLLSTQPVSSGSNSPLPQTPQTSHTTLLDSTTSWMLVRDTLTVNEAFEYLTIGNFKDDASTIRVSNPGSGGGPGQYGCYYFVDDVSVRNLSTMTGTENRIASPQAWLPQNLPLSSSASLSPTLPAGGEIVSFSVYNLKGQTVFQGSGMNGSWKARSTGVYVWDLRWSDALGTVHAQRGKVLVHQ